MDGGKRAITIDEVPLDWCIGRGVKLDFRSMPDGHVVTAQEVEAEFDRIGHSLQAGDIVLVNTGAAAHYGTPAYVPSGCGIGREATNWMTARGMRVCGTDAWSWDAPFVHTAKKVAETGDASLIWEGHRASMDRAYCHMEKLANLETLPATGFEVQCFPVKIKGASAGWCRPVAIIRD
jgi:kynurenine formamidase